MSHIHIKHAHQLAQEDVRQRVEGIAEDLKRKLHVQYQWKGDAVLFKRPGAQGRIDLGENFVEITMKLGLLVLPLKDKIEAQIREEIADYLS